MVRKLSARWTAPFIVRRSRQRRAATEPVLLPRSLNGPSNLGVIAPATDNDPDENADSSFASYNEVESDFVSCGNRVAALGLKPLRIG